MPKGSTGKQRKGLSMDKPEVYKSNNGKTTPPKKADTKKA